MILKNIYSILLSVQENKPIQYLRNNSDLLANHLLVLIAFFYLSAQKQLAFFMHFYFSSFYLKKKNLMQS